MNDERRLKVTELLRGLDNDLIENGRSINTRQAYRSDILQFVDFAGPPEEWGTESFEKYKTKLLAERKKVTTINRKLQAIRQFIKYLKACGLDINAKVRTVKYQKQEFLQEVFSKSDVERIITLAMNGNDYLTVAAVSGMQKTGCRVSELLQWRADEVRSEKIQVIGKGNKVRFLLIPPSLNPLLVAYAGERAGNPEPLFMNPKTGKAYTRQRVDQLIKKYAKMARIKKERAHAHSLRHHHGQRLRELGMTSEDIAELDGHSDTRTTDIYTRSTEKQLRVKISQI